MRDIILASLDDHQAEEVSVIDLAGKSTIADYMVVATGHSSRHVSTLADSLTRTLKAAGMRSVPIEGAARCDWILMDAGDVIVHLFRPEVRAFYNLEKMWGAGLPEAGRAGEASV